MSIEVVFKRPFYDNQMGLFSEKMVHVLPDRYVKPGRLPLDAMIIAGEGEGIPLEEGGKPAKDQREMSRVEAQQLRDEANKKRRADRGALTEESKDINEDRAPEPKPKGKGKGKGKGKAKK
jgi:hypothetical protein